MGIFNKIKKSLAVVDKFKPFLPSPARELINVAFMGEAMAETVNQVIKDSKKKPSSK